MTELRLPLPSYAYRFDLLLEFARRIAFPARLIVQGDTLWRFVDGQLLSFRQDANAIHVRGASICAANRSRIATISTRALGLCNDLSPFYEFAESNETLWRVVEPLVGLPMHCAETVFEALVTLIIEQHIAWKTALRSQRALMNLLTEPARVGNVAVYNFPAPDKVAHATAAALKPLKITNRRISLIVDIASALARGDLELESLRSLPPARAYDKLLTIKGVGPWTAGNVIGRAFGKYPFVSQNDVALQAAVRRYFHGGNGEKSAMQVGDTLAPFGEFAGMAGHFVLLRWVMDNYPPTVAEASSG